MKQDMTLEVLAYVAAKESGKRSAGCIHGEVPPVTAAATSSNRRHVKGHTLGPSTDSTSPTLQCGYCGRLGHRSK